jgi:hypothetical protein
MYNLFINYLEKVEKHETSCVYYMNWVKSIAFLENIGTLVFASCDNVPLWQAMLHFTSLKPNYFIPSKYLNIVKSRDEIFLAWHIWGQLNRQIVQCCQN